MQTMQANTRNTRTSLKPVTLTNRNQLFSANYQVEISRSPCFIIYILQINILIPKLNYSFYNTRAKPLKETFRIQIRKSFRAPNKKKSTDMNKSISKNFNSVATQTVATSYKRRGLDPLDLSKHENLSTA